MNLYREFVLDSHERWHAAMRCVDANIAAQIADKNPLRLILTTAAAKRNAEQNKYYWRGVLTQIADQVWIEGKRYSKEVWHEEVARKFGIHEEIQLPCGDMVLKRKSTTEMTVKEFSFYLEEVTAWAASELGVIFYAPEGRYEAVPQ